MAVYTFWPIVPFTSNCNMKVLRDICNSVSCSVSAKSQPAAIAKRVRAWQKPTVTGFTISIAIKIMSIAGALWFGDFVASVTALVPDKAELWTKDMRFPSFFYHFTLLIARVSQKTCHWDTIVFLLRPFGQYVYLPRFRF